MAHNNVPERQGSHNMMDVPLTSWMANYSLWIKFGSWTVFCGLQAKKVYLYFNFSRLNIISQNLNEFIDIKELIGEKNWQMSQ